MFTQAEIGFGTSKVMDTPRSHENALTIAAPSPTPGRTVLEHLSDAVTRLRQHAAPTASRLWKWKWPLASATIALLLTLLLGPTLLWGPRIVGEAAVRGTFLQTVVASGHVEAPFRGNIGSQITGVVADVVVAEGETVKAGQTLILLNDREARAAVVQMEGAVAQAQAHMRQLRELTMPSANEAMKEAQATLLNAQQAFDRAQKLAVEGYSTKVTLEAAVKALDIAKGQLRSTELHVYTNSPGGSDFVMGETLLKQAQANLASAQSRLSYTTITAPRDGVLIFRNVERGNVVQPSTVLMTLSPVGETHLTLQIDEKNLGLIAVGQTALASADAFSKQMFAAEVFFINPGIDLQRAGRNRERLPGRGRLDVLGRHHALRGEEGIAHGAMRPEAFVRIQAV